MQIGTVAPRALMTAAPKTTLTRQTTTPPNDSVSLGHSSWTESAFGKGVVTVAKGAAVAGGIPALGALAAQAGGLGIVGALAGSAALGAYLGTTIDLDNSKLEKAAFGASLAGLGCMIGSVAGQVGGVAPGLMVAGTFGAIGAFRGVLETLADHNWI